MTSTLKFALDPPAPMGNLADQRHSLGVNGVCDEPERIRASG